MIQHFNKSNCKKTAKKYGITNYEYFNLTRNNLILGINGSGKTRMLNMIKDLCEEQEYTLIYMDFSQLGNKYDNTAKLPKEEQNAFNWALMYKHSGITDNREGVNDLVRFTINNLESLINYINKPSFGDFSEKRFNEINPFLEEVLGRKIIRVNNKFHITRRENASSSIDISQAIKEMSPGERSIICFVFQLAIMEELKMEYLLLIDEPETHLHPIALTKLIKHIQTNLNPKYLFICTHSVFLIPFFDFDEIKMMENNAVNKPSSKLYNDIYSKLIGFESSNEKSIYTFLTSIYEWNYSSFLAECFTNPNEVTEGNVQDIQFIKLKKTIQSYNKKNSIRVLDYGSGSGRIGKCFELLENESPGLPVWSKLKYAMYDKYVLPNACFKRKKWFDKIIKNDKELKNEKSSFDIIILYNVLHEIPVEEWTDVLNQIIDLLDNNGCIIFGERRVLSKGENPYGTSGYLVLGENEIKELFSISQADIVEVTEQDSDPTMCCIIKKSDLVFPIYEKNVISAIRTLKKRVADTIGECISNGTKDRKYAFYCQEYFNCMNALGEFIE